MTRHELLLAQTATSPSRPAGDLAPLDGWIVITPSIGHICHGKCSSRGLFIAPHASDLTSSPQVQARHPTGQIQKNP
jgi:hypothetical protein